MNICMRVCFCLRTAFPVKQIKTSKYQVGSGNETLNCRVPMPFSPPRLVQARALVQHSSVAHIDRHMHTTDTQRTAEVKPSLPLSRCVCLGVEVSGGKPKTKLPLPRIYS